MSGKQPTKKGKEVVQDRYEEEFTEDEIRDEHAQPDPETEEEPTFTKRIPWKDLADEDLPWGVSRHADGHFVVTNDFIYPFDRIVNILSEDYPNRINDFCKEVLASSDTISCESFHKRILDLEWIKGINEFYQEKAASEANLGIVPDGQNTDALAHVPRGSISRSRRPSVSTVGTNASRSRRAQDDQWKCCKCKKNNKLELEKCKSSKDPRCYRHKRCGNCTDVEGNNIKGENATPDGEKPHYPYIRKHKQEDN